MGRGGRRSGRLGGTLRRGQSVNWNCLARAMGSILRMAKASGSDGSSYAFAASSVHARTALDPGSPIGLNDRIFRLAPGAFKLALDLLSNAFNPERCVAGQFTRLLPCAPSKFVDSALHSVLIHRPTSVD